MLEQLADRPAAADRRCPAPDHRQGRRAGGLCLRRALVDGLCHAGNPGHPGRGRGRRPLAMPFRSPSPLWLLLAIVTISYEQTIHAYPGGGGAYIVARDNLGELPAAGRRRGPADRLHPDRGRIDLVRRGPDRLGLSGAASITASSIAVGAGAVRHADQPARRAGNRARPLPFPPTSSWS